MAFFNEKRAWFISNGDFDEWVLQNYGHPYEVMVEEEAYEEAIVYEVTGTFFSMDLYNQGKKGKECYAIGVDHDDLAAVEVFRLTGAITQILTKLFLDIAVVNGDLEAGTYVIEVGDG